ncbi:beta-1,3-galactosyltransferase 1-like isoform X2 [Gadus chalcogrammus]|uniref:beta-1,3-galactosyltransferase 1-like isoform X2 n=1 Tax=Gadus chalcogrammus TaxID=1042646 RepID=UPI0024C4B491|nr:beta-1,3-galactosyltransferase 1-like isoform X2 [Gadus chalcogrammus]
MGLLNLKPKHSPQRAIWAMFASRQLQMGTRRISLKLGAELFSKGKSWCCPYFPLFLLLMLTTTIMKIAIDSNLFQSSEKLFYISLKGENAYKQFYVEYPHKYHFIINQEEKCQRLRPFLVLMVPVAPHNRAHRDSIRQTWGKESSILGKTVSLFFLLGLARGGGGPGDRQQQQQQLLLLQESRVHGDLLQSNFLDCYKNLTIKTMVMMEWLDAHCPAASYAMKIDSDMFLNVRNLVNMLLDAPRGSYMTGLVTTGAEVRRDPSSKWYLPVDVLPMKVYPRYALGLGYIVSLDLPGKLVEASRHVRPLYIEDIHLGFCMKYLGIDLSDPPQVNDFNFVPVLYNRCDYSRLIATTYEPHANRIQVWEDFNREDPVCQEEKEIPLLNAPTKRAQ